MIFHKLKIKDIRQETADCVSIAFDIPPSSRDKVPQYQSDFSYIQGQYLTLKAHIGGEEVRRSYSICSAPYENELRIAIKKVEGGLFSTFANEKLKKGDIVEVAPPDGRFFPKKSPPLGGTEGGLVLIAAGSGITPIFSILKTILKEEPETKITLIYGNKNAASVIFREAIEGLKNKYMSRLSVFHVLSREKVDAELLHGRINAAKMSDFIAKMPEILRGSAYFICGPEDMIQDVKSVLIEKGIDKKDIHFELFGTNKSHQKREIKTAENIISTAKITLDGIAFDVPIHEGEAVLDAALRMGADLPFACKGGVCCTCRAMLTEGSVDMEVNYALDPEEVERGFILTCQAVPKTPHLAVSFDVK
jgi:ring-1,2-phenylacetyl-CoA epoxidase subunit PaaE